MSDTIYQFDAILNNGENINFEDYQGKGYSKLLIDKIINFPELKAIDKWMLATRDAHTLYEKFGFTAIKSPEKLMEKLSKRAKIIYE